MKVSEEGKRLAASIMPFAYSKHTLSKGEFIEMVGKMFDNATQKTKNPVISLKDIQLENLLEVLADRQAQDSSVSGTIDIELLESTDTLGESDKVKFYAQSVYQDVNGHFLGTN